MATLAELEAQRVSLLKQLSAAKSVRHGDKSVENRDVSDIREAIRALDSEINRQGGGSRRRQIRIYTDTGM